VNDCIEDLLYQSGLTAQGCWDELDDYAKQSIEKFAELIVRECAELSADNPGYNGLNIFDKILKHFGVKE
jgi:hypothetical protein